MIVHTQVLVGNDPDSVVDKLYWEAATFDLTSVMFCYRKPEFGSHVILHTGDQMVIAMPYEKLKRKLSKLDSGNTIYFQKPKPN